VAYCRDALLDRLPFPRVAPQLPKGSKRAESGTLNHEGIVGTGAAITFLADASGSAAGPLRERIVATMTRLAADEEALFASLVDGLRGLPNVRLYEPPAGVPRHPTVAFTVDGMASYDVAARLSENNAVFVSHGNFYAATAVAKVAPEANASGGVVRAGLAIYSTASEIERLIAGIAALQGGY
jgi:selenocysteine lyase/cysteine desulfurase